MNFGSLKSKRVLGVLGAIALVAGILGGVFLVASQGSLSLVSKAGPTAVPRQVLMTNVDSDTFTVSWISDTNVSGFVKYGESPSKLDQTLGDDRDQLSGEVDLSTTHYVTLRNLKPDTDYYFELGSGSQTYNNAEGAPYQTRTALAAAAKPNADIISGKVVLPNGQPAPGAIVYVDIGEGAPRSAQAKTSGVWTLQLSLTRTADLASYLSYDMVAEQLNIFVQAADIGTATAIVTTANDSPVTDITLGESLELASPVASQSGSQEVVGNVIEIKDNAISTLELMVTPGVQVTVINKDGVNHSITAVGLGFDSGVIGGGGNGSFVAPETPGTYAFYDSVNPEMEALKGRLVVIGGVNEEATTPTATQSGGQASSAEIGAGFGGISAPDYPEIDEAYEATLSVSLATPIEQGENIATSSPEIKLAGPAGQKITITVRSDPQTEEVTVGADGLVDWTPPEGLDPGEHELEIEYVDEAGVLQKITRTFVVLADEPTTGQGGLPAFSSTPSATLTPTPTLISSESATIESSSSSMPSTSSGIPESGVLTLTVTLFMMGIGLFAGGVFWQVALAKRNSK